MMKTGICLFTLAMSAAFQLKADNLSNGNTAAKSEIIADYGVPAKPAPAQTPTNGSKSVSPAKPTDKQKRWLGDCTAKETGVCTVLEKYVKKRLKDQKTYKHVKTTYTYSDEHVLVAMRYKAQTPTGNYYVEEIRAQIGYNCEMKQVVYHGH
ncbi:MAG: hypothetical protein V4543_01470 [Bacteroidota bacterium]